MLAWDLSIDPCLGHLYPFWVWDSPGAYYGIPVSNFAGWFAVGVLAMVVLDRSPHPPTPNRFLIPYYGANLAMPMGLAVLSGMWLAAVFTVAAAILGLLLAERAESSRQSPAAAASRPLGGGASQPSSAVPRWK
jgi:putative membrane protein